jgi:hypothetical protein
VKRLIDAMRRKQGQLWRDCSLIPYLDSVLAHSSLQVSQFLAGKSISTANRPLYFPYMTPADFWLFPELKIVLKGKCFPNIENNMSSVKSILTHVPVQDFNKLFRMVAIALGTL